jgi:hypothetical protein
MATPRQDLSMRRSANAYDPDEILEVADQGIKAYYTVHHGTH